MKTIYPTPGIFSIWVGSFESEVQFDKEIEQRIEANLKLAVPLSAICEVTFIPNPVKIISLLEGFSGWKTFAADASVLAQRKGISEANSALACYYLQIENPSDVWGRMRFLGSLHGQDVA